MLNFIQSHLKYWYVYSFMINHISLAICSPCWLKFKNSDRFSSNTRGIIILHWLFDVSVIIGNYCLRLRGIELKSKIGIDSHLNTWGIFSRNSQFYLSLSLYIYGLSFLFYFNIWPQSNMLINKPSCPTCSKKRQYFEFIFFHFYRERNTS